MDDLRRTQHQPVALTPATICLLIALVWAAILVLLFRSPVLPLAFLAGVGYVLIYNRLRSVSEVNARTAMDAALRDLEAGNGDIRHRLAYVAAARLYYAMVRKDRRLNHRDSYHLLLDLFRVSVSPASLAGAELVIRTLPRPLSLEAPPGVPQDPKSPDQVTRSCAALIHGRGPEGVDLEELLELVPSSPEALVIAIDSLEVSLEILTTRRNRDRLVFVSRRCVPADPGIPPLP